MKTALAVTILLSLVLVVAAQPRGPATTGAASQPATQAPPQPATPNLTSILADLQRTTQATNVDISRLRIEKWKTDESERQQMQQVSASLQKNITMAIPGLINEAQAAPGSVSKVFKLYDDLTLVYEFLNSLTEAAGTYGKKDEYTPLANDASALDKARQSLSGYIEQAANHLEIQAQKPPPVAQQAQSAPQTPKKIIIDDDNPAPKRKPKKKPAPTPTPSQSSSPPQ